MASFSYKPIPWPGLDIPKPGRGVKMYNPGQTAAGVEKAETFIKAFAETVRFMPKEERASNEQLLAKASECGVEVDDDLFSSDKSGKELLTDLLELGRFVKKMDQKVQELGISAENWQAEMGAFDSLPLFDLLGEYNKLPELDSSAYYSGESLKKISEYVFANPEGADEVVSAGGYADEAGIVISAGGYDIAVTNDPELKEKLAEASKKADQDTPADVMKRRQEVLASYCREHQTKLVRFNDQGLSSQRRKVAMLMAREPVGTVCVSISMTAMTQMQTEMAEKMEKRSKDQDRMTKIAEKARMKKSKELEQKAIQDGKARKIARSQEAKKGSEANGKR